MKDLWAEKVAPRNLPAEVYEVASALFPVRVGDDRFMHPTSGNEVVAAWDALRASGSACSKLRGILLDTGDVTVPRFERPYFDGNGTSSTLQAQVLLDRVRYGFSVSSGVSQGSLTEEEARPILEAIIRDVAVAFGQR